MVGGNRRWLQIKPLARSQYSSDSTRDYAPPLEAHLPVCGTPTTLLVVTVNKALKGSKKGMMLPFLAGDDYDHTHKHARRDIWYF